MRRGESVVSGKAGGSKRRMSMRGRRVWPVLAAVALGCALVAEAGSAPDRAARGAVLTYRDVSGYGPAVAYAIQSWNEARTGVRFVPARGKPDFTIRSAAIVRKPGTRQQVSGLGAPGFGVVLSRKVLGDARRVRQYQILVAAHELGHVLGLQHTRAACSIMKQNVGLSQFARACLSRPGGSVGDGYLRCGPSHADARAVARKNRRPAPPASSHTGFCRAAGDGLFAASYEAPEVNAPRAEVAIKVRNAGTAPWHSDATLLEVVYTEGSLAGTKLVFQLHVPGIAPGETASFALSMRQLARGTDVAFTVRLLESEFNVYMGEAQTMRVHVPA